MAGQPNNSWNTSDGDVDLALERSCTFYRFVVNTIVTGIIIGFGIVGNSLAVVVFWKDSTKTSASFLFQSLALADTAFLLVAIPIIPVRSYVNYTFRLNLFREIRSYEIVYIWPCLVVAWTASIWIVVLFAVNRYIAVCFPLKSLHWCTISNVKKQLAIVLIFAILVNIPRFLKSRIEYLTIDNGTTYRTFVYAREFTTMEVYVIYYKIVFFYTVTSAIPLVILTVLNIRLMKALKTSRRNQMEMLSRRQQHDNSATFILIIVVVVFITCQLPSLINSLIRQMTSYRARVCGDYLFYITPVTNALVLLNSAVNFVIYAVFNKRFRHVLTQTVCGSRRIKIGGRWHKWTGRRPHVRHFQHITTSADSDIVT